MSFSLHWKPDPTLSTSAWISFASETVFSAGAKTFGGGEGPSSGFKTCCSSCWGSSILEFEVDFLFVDVVVVVVVVVVGGGGGGFGFGGGSGCSGSGGGFLTSSSSFVDSTFDSSCCCCCNCCSCCCSSCCCCCCCWDDVSTSIGCFSDFWPSKDEWTTLKIWRKMLLLPPEVESSFPDPPSMTSFPVLLLITKKIIFL